MVITLDHSSGAPTQCKKKGPNILTSNLVISGTKEAKKNEVVSGKTLSSTTTNSSDANLFTSVVGVESGVYWVIGLFLVFIVL